MTDRIKQMAEEAKLLQRYSASEKIDLDAVVADQVTLAELAKFAALVAEDLAEFVRMKQQRSGRTDIDGIKHGHWPVDLAEQMLARYGIKGE